MRLTTRTLGWPAVIAAGLLFGWGASRLLASRVVAARDRAAVAAEPARYMPTRASYDSTVVYVNSRLAPRELDALGTVAGGREGPWLVIMLGRGDLASCEDLGRQLRELLRREPGARVLVWTVESQREPVSRYLHREKVNAGILATATLPPLGHATATTPAALRVDPATGTVEGVAHSLRFPNLRARSFADELHDLALYRR